MKPDDSVDEFMGYVAQHGGGEVADLTPHRGVELLLGFFRDVAAEGCALSGDGDSLRLRWGIRQWEDGERFDYEMARQFMALAVDEALVSQLSLTFSFEAEPRLRSLGNGELRCGGREELEAFVQTVASCAALVVVADRTDSTVDLGYAYVE